MAHSVSALKRIRQNEKKKIYNRSIKREVNTYFKRFQAQLADGDSEKAQGLLNRCISKLDLAQKKGVMHKNTVAHRKSALWKQLNKATPTS